MPPRPQSLPVHHLHRVDAPRRCSATSGDLPNLLANVDIAEVVAAYVAEQEEAFETDPASTLAAKAALGLPRRLVFLSFPGVLPLPLFSISSLLFLHILLSI